MSATFNPFLEDSTSLVRQLAGDTDTTDAKVQDETIDALISQAIAQGASAAGAPYCAAAQVGEMIAARWAASGGGVIEKTVSHLRIRYAEGTSASVAYRDYLHSLKETCTRLSLSSPGVLRAW